MTGRATVTVPDVEDLRTLHAAVSLAITLYDAVDEEGGVPTDAPLHGKRERLAELARLLDHEANCRNGAAGAHPVQLDMVDFFRGVGGLVGETPGLRNEDLNADLILEEAGETAESITGRRVVFHFDDDAPPSRPRSLVGAIDGLCDLLATVYGAAVTFGVDLAPFWSEVHRTNMAKAGGPERADGKRLKPEGWEPPDIEGVLEREISGESA
ncbi:MAG TPA: hypothetical protein VFN92_08165 [Solirubrobacterales bacterium]|nr:hypothetical protein [Solirubrobacterales bacterium]